MEKLSDNENRVVASLKWSFMTEVLVKVISPITSMILARIIDPNEFGIVSSVLIITSFAEMFTDGGFQAFLIKHQFKDKDEFANYVSVVFWSNLIISSIFCVCICFLAPYLAAMVHIENHNSAIRIYSLLLIFTSYSGTQFAVYRKYFKFKELGKYRIISKIIPLITTIPLAILGLGYWAIIIGNLSGGFITDIILFVKSDTKIKIYYNLGYIKTMFKFSSGILLNSVIAWTMTNLCILLVGRFLTSYYLGIYQMSVNLVGQITSIITASTINVFLSDIAVKQENLTELNNTIYKYQFYLGAFVAPVGIGFIIFRNFITYFFLGDMWSEAALMIGLWGFVTCQSIVFVEIGQNACIARGFPYYVAFSNIIQIIILTSVIISLRWQTFSIIVIGICLSRGMLAVTHYTFMKKATGVKLTESLKRLVPFYIPALLMGMAGYIITKMIENTILQGMIGIPFCIIFYFTAICMNNKTRVAVVDIKTRLLRGM